MHTKRSAMTHLDKVTSLFDDVPYMRHSQAVLMRDFIVEHDARDILELGFCYGKSSAYFAAILEDLGRGHLVTVDRDGAQHRTPNVEQVLSELALAHRVTAVYAERSYTWEMAKMIRATPRAQFDICYFDGGHTWDATGFGFLLVDLLLRPGGWIVFDDLQWTVDAAMKEIEEPPRHWLALGADERTTPAVKLVFDLLVPHLGYTDRRTMNNGEWGAARKPLDPANRPSRRGLFRRLSNAFAHR